MKPENERSSDRLRATSPCACHGRCGVRHRRRLNFTLSTTAGDLDLLGEITGGGTYEELLTHSRPLELFGLQCLCIDLETLIHVKRAAGRPMDFEALAELETLREERDRR